MTVNTQLKTKASRAIGQNHVYGAFQNICRIFSYTYICLLNGKWLEHKPWWMVVATFDVILSWNFNLKHNTTPLDSSSQLQLGEVHPFFRICGFEAAILLQMGILWSRWRFGHFLVLMCGTFVYSLGIAAHFERIDMNRSANSRVCQREKSTSEYLLSNVLQILNQLR